MAKMPADEFSKGRYVNEWWQVVDLEEGRKYHERNIGRCLKAISVHGRGPIRVLAVHGSGRSNSDLSCAHELSNSQLLCRAGLDAIRGDPSVVIEEVNLREYQIEYCNNCYSTCSALCGFPCVVGSERVRTETGWKPISEVRRGDLLTTGRVTKAWCSGIKEIFTVRLSDGRKLRITDNHPVKILSRMERVKDNGIWLYRPVYEWCTVGNLKVGDKVPFVTGGGWGTSPKKYRVFDYVLSGLIFGDGTFSGKGAAYTTLYFEEASRLGEIVSAISPYSCREGRHTCDSPTMRKLVWEKCVKGKIQGLGLDKSTGAWERRVPDTIMSGAERAACAFLKGWFSTDGSVSRRKGYWRVSLTAASVDALRDGQLLLSRLGVRSAVYDLGHLKTVLKGKTYRRSSQLQISDADSIRIFAEKVGFLENKSPKLRQALAESENRRSCKRPYGKVVSVVKEPFLLPVYDLTVAGSHEFVAEGIPVHNCNCFPLDPMQDLYPKVLACDVLLCSTGVNQSAMSSRLKAFCDRLISLDGGYLVSPEQFASKDSEWRDRCIALSQSDEVHYDQRQHGRVAAFFISSKDTADVEPTEDERYNEIMERNFYIQLVADSLYRGFWDYGYYMPNPWFAAHLSHPNEELSFDKARLNADIQAQELARHVVIEAVNLAGRFRDDPPEPRLHPVGRT